MNRELFHSPLRMRPSHAVRMHQKSQITAFLGSPSCPGVKLLGSKKKSCLEGYLCLFTDFADNLYTRYQGAIIDLAARDEEVINGLITAAEDRLVSIGRSFIAAIAERRDGRLIDILRSRGFETEYCMILNRVSPVNERGMDGIILKRACYSDYRQMLDMGASRVRSILPVERYESEEAMREEYLKGHAFDWWRSPSNFCPYLIIEKKKRVTLGFVIIELERLDFMTGVEEAHIIDLMFRDFTLEEEFLSTLISNIDHYLCHLGYEMRLLQIPSADCETLALLETVDRGMDIERIQMVKKIGHFLPGTITEESLHLASARPSYMGEDS